MKVPPKRKGNDVGACTRGDDDALNESPSEKEGKLDFPVPPLWLPMVPSMKVPPKRKGNLLSHRFYLLLLAPSMKVPPKRKGNAPPGSDGVTTIALNESPSEKEGK